MAFLDQDHIHRINKINQLWIKLNEIQELATKNNIKDIFQDNGAKILQQITYLNFKALPEREGNDAISEDGTEWEMKSLNLATSARSFTTNHHINRKIINKYRKVPWSFAVYNGIILQEIWIVTPDKMEYHYKQWENKIASEEDKPITNQGNTLNNPHINLSWVRKNGVQVYPFDKQHPISPIDVIKA